jgi:RNA polymerase sigma factor (sigma-70 family)
MAHHKNDPSTAQADETNEFGDLAELDAIYRTQAPKIVASVRGRLRSDQEAQDIVQDAFVRFLGFVSRQRPRDPGAVLNRITRNLLINRSQLSRNVVPHVPIGDNLGLAVPAVQCEEMEVEQMREQYRAIVASLPPRMREVFILHRLEDLSYKEIAARLDISIRTVEWHFAEAIIRIDKALERE